MDEEYVKEARKLMENTYNTEGRLEIVLAKALEIAEKLLELENLVRPGDNERLPGKAEHRVKSNV